MTAHKRIHVGEIATVHGVRGLVKVRAFGDDIRTLQDFGPLYTSETGTEKLTLTLKHQDYQREAIIQFPPPLRPNGRPDVEKQRVDLDAVRNAVTSSIEAGWEPASRGRPMVFDVDAEGR